MMITAVLHVSVRTAACPPESLWPVVVHLLFISLELRFEFALQIVRFFYEAITPTHLGARKSPSDELKSPFVAIAVIALAVLIVPLWGHFAVRFMGEPVGTLAFGSCL